MELRVQRSTISPAHLPPDLALGSTDMAGLLLLQVARAALCLFGAFDVAAATVLLLRVSDGSLRGNLDTQVCLVWGRKGRASV